MGYMVHHAIIVTAWDEKHIKEAHAMAVNKFAHLVTNVVEARANNYYTFLIGPDGSKLGWSISDDHDELRDEYVQWMRAATDKGVYLEWALIQYGDDGRDDRLIMSNQTDPGPTASAPAPSGPAASSPTTPTA